MVSGNGKEVTTRRRRLPDVLFLHQRGTRFVLAVSIAAMYARIRERRHITKVYLAMYDGMVPSVWLRGMGTGRLPTPDRSVLVKNKFLRRLVDTSSTHATPST